MNILTKVSGVLAASSVLALTLLFGITSNASADCIYQYNSTSFQTSVTPSFNLICGAPQVGDESNFVRIRPDVANNDEDDTSNPTYTSGTLNSACVSGDKFDIWNYVHNDASTNENPDVGNGDAVATGTYLNMQTPQSGSTSDSFNFSGTVGDTGNLTGTAGPTSTTNITPAVLDCDGQKVQLTIVPGSINEYSQPYNNGWENLPGQSQSNMNSFFNTNLPIGSTSTGGMSSGSQWACWTYRIVVVYQVEVTPVPTQTTPAVCTEISANDQADVKSISYTANSANVTGYSIVLFNGSNTSGTPLASSGNLGLNGLPYQFDTNLIKSGQRYTIVGTVLTSLGNETSANCQFSFTTPTTPPTPGTPVTTTSTTLPNTGPGTAGTIAIFTGTVVAGAALYNRFLRRRLANNK